MAVAIQSVMHVNVNCSSLDRSLDFYEQGLGLTAGAHTSAIPQDGSGMGLEGEVVWDAYILQDHRGFAGPGLDLLEWKQPPPLGQPPRDVCQPGYQQLAIGVPDLAAAQDALARVGAAPRGDPRAMPETTFAAPGARQVLVRDPDGTALRIVERPDLEAAELQSVAISCRDLLRSREWYERVIGCETRGLWSSQVVDAASHGLTGEAVRDVCELAPGGLDGFGIELVEWRRPGATDGPARAANQLGLYRVAFMVEDMQESCAELMRQGVEPPAPVCLDMGPDIPVEGLWALFFPDPDGTCVELIETPRL